MSGRTRAVAAGVAIAGLAAPAAPAMPMRERVDPPRDAAPPPIRVIEARADGLDWGDAGIGAAGTVALLGMAGGLVAIGRGRRPAR